MRVLILFSHGLGDAVQLTVVLRQLRHHHPDWNIHVAALVGKHSALRGLSERVFIVDRDLVGDELDATRYDKVFQLDWHEPDRAYAGLPATKAEKCLYEVFGLEPIPSLCGYEMRVGCDARRVAAQYLGELAGPPNNDGRFRAVLLHYQGNTSQSAKDLDHQTARDVCEQAMAAGYVPIILDWDQRSPLPGDGRVFCPPANHWLWGCVGTGDAEVLAALIGQASLFVGIDSGPQKVAATTNTPAISVWIGHHPLHYHGLANNVTHLVPQGHLELLRGDRRVGEQAFTELYRYREYDSLGSTLAQLLEDHLGPRQNALVFHQGFAVRRDNVDQDGVVIGDVFERDAYAVSHLPLPHEIVVDVGAHIGCFAARWRRRNPQSRIFCIEACPENLPALRANVAAFAKVVHAACTYERGEMGLLNAVWPACVSTGGSRVVPAEVLADQPTEKKGRQEYWHDTRRLPTVTLEALMKRFDLPRIDVLKLDCEGSEFSILQNTTCLDQIGMIVGEYHGSSRFRELVSTRFEGWIHHIGLPDRYGNDCGPFWLTNPRLRPTMNDREVGVSD